MFNRLFPAKRESDFGKDVERVFCLCTSCKKDTDFGYK